MLPEGGHPEIDNGVCPYAVSQSFRVTVGFGPFLAIAQGNKGRENFRDDRKKPAPAKELKTIWQMSNVEM
jgi:hypothetical protein